MNLRKLLRCSGIMVELEVLSASILMIIRVVIAVVLFLIYLKNRRPLVLYFAAFFLFIGVQILFRALSVSMNNPLMFFMHELTLILSAAVMLQGLASIGIEWLRKYKVPYLLAVFAFLFAFRDSFLVEDFLLNRESGTGIIAVIISGIGFLIASYYFYTLGKYLPNIGKNLLVFGFGLLGILVILAVPIVSIQPIFGLPGIVFINLNGIIFTTMIGVGWLLSLGKQINTSNS